MRFLALDTSTKYTVMALGEGERLLHGQRLLLDKSRLGSMESLIDQGLKKSKCKISDIDCFGVGIGPGSFTGLRIGLSAVKGLSYALKKPCLVFSSLDAIAFSQPENFQGDLCVAVDARRSNVYASFYRKKGFVLKKDFGDALLTKEDLLGKMSGSIVVCGDAILAYREDFCKKMRGDLRIAAEDLWYPTPEGLAFLTRESFKKKKFSDSFRISANYLYKEDCQVHKTC